MRILASVLVLSFFTTSCKNSTDYITPQSKQLMEAVYASGYVVAEGEYEVYAQAQGYLTAKLVEAGDTLRAGQPMFVIGGEQQSARFDAARENYLMAKRNFQEGSPVLEELKAAMEAAKTRRAFDSLTFYRYENLLQQNATSRAEYDRAKLAYENSVKEFALQSSRYNKARNQLYLELQNAESQLRIAQEESSNYTIKSEIDGMVFQTLKEEGEMIRAGEKVAVVGKRDGFFLELTVDEMDVTRVKQGQEVLVKIDAYPSKVFRAEVSQIYPLVDKRQQSIQVDAVLKDDLPDWFSGLALEANIVIRKKDNALVIPKNALLPGDSVIIKTDDGDRKLRVETGIETLDEVEIVSGIDHSAQIKVN